MLDVQTGDYEAPDQSDTGVLFEEEKVIVAVATTEDFEKTVSYQTMQSVSLSLSAYFLLHT